MNIKAKNKGDLLRSNKKMLCFNNLELKAINHYCKKYHVKNKSKFMRETIIKSILSHFDRDYPSLFDNQPTLFSKPNC